MITDRDIAPALATLAGLFNVDVTEATALLYFSALADLDRESFQRAVLRAARECRFMPKPAELRELADGRVEDRAQLAWATVLYVLAHPPEVGFDDTTDMRRMPSMIRKHRRAAISFHDPAINGAVRTVAGDWNALHREWLATRRREDPQPLGVLRAAFVRAYVALAREGCPAELAGALEPLRVRGIAELRREMTIERDGTIVVVQIPTLAEDRRSATNTLGSDCTLGQLAESTL